MIHDGYTPVMSTLVLHLDDTLVSRLTTAAARSHKALPDWAAEQLSRLADSGPSPTYSQKWQSAFGSISDPSFEAPTRPLPRQITACVMHPAHNH